MNSRLRVVALAVCAIFALSSPGAGQSLLYSLFERYTDSLRQQTGIPAISAVILKGGHLPTGDIVDLLFEDGEFLEFRSERIPGLHTHGTGCTFAASITASLALGRTLREAIPLAQRYIAGAIRRAPEVGRGHGPMDHFWSLY